MKPVKVDYTLTPEYNEAILEYRMDKSLDWQRGNFGFPIVGSPTFVHAQDVRNEYFRMLANSLKGTESVSRRVPFVRTICKIAARILFVLLLVGVAVGVML